MNWRRIFYSLYFGLSAGAFGFLGYIWMHIAFGFYVTIYESNFVIRWLEFFTLMSLCFSGFALAAVHDRG